MEEGCTEAKKNAEAGRPCCVSSLGLLALDHTLFVQSHFDTVIKTVIMPMQ
jgi:hypothetical protein